MSVHPCPNESTLLPMLASVSTISAVQGTIDITMERTASVPGLSLDSENIKLALKNAVSTNRIGPSVNNRLFSSYSLVLGDPFTGIINPLDSPPFFFANRCDDLDVKGGFGDGSKHDRIGKIRKGVPYRGIYQASSH